MHTPDEMMGRPIDDVIFWTIVKLNQWNKVIEFDDEALDWWEREFGENDRVSRTGYLAALRGRAKEVVEYCSRRVRIDGVTEQMVRDDPFLICACIGKVLGTLDE